MTTFRAADLFRLIARRSGSPEHERAVENLNDRLGALRVAEGRLFENGGEELSSLVAAFRESDAAALRRGVAAYHRRRQRSVPEILVAARTPVEEIS